MPSSTSPTPDPRPIEAQADLDAFCARLQEADYVTVDTEFMRDATYWPKLCLIQLADAETARAVDALAPGLDLKPVWRLLASPVPKVMHAARQDIEIFFHMGGVIPEPLLDTQVAAMVCGFGDQAAYDTLVKHFAGRRLDKRARFADWGRRPLPDRQIDYALADVVWLRPVYEGLVAELRRNGRADWVEEEEAVLLDPETYRLDPVHAWKRLKTRSADPSYLAVVQAVAAWREREAQRLDLPRNRVLRDDALLDVAAQAPADADALAHCRAVTRGMATGRLGPGLLAAVAEGKAVAPEDRPKPEPQRDRPKGIGPAMELLRVLLKARVEHEGVAQKLVASAEDLEDLAGGAEDGPLMQGWRKDLFGADAQRLLRGELALTVKRGRVVVSELL
ncbi:MAG: ribonuclease D [Alphaproteobacteria bacterium]|nr:ribonuclease D [Alphaproteobacteria bacterium]